MTAADPVTAAVVVAAGAGDRLGAGGPKALVAVAGGTLLDHALLRLTTAGIDRLVVVHPPEDEERFADVVSGHPVDALVPGGPTRAASVRAGVAAVADDVTIVAVHDAARAFTPPATIRACLAAVTDDVIAAAPCRPVADTLKRATGDPPLVAGTVDRTGLQAVQTPQVVRRDVLDRALGWPEAGDRTDDLGLIEAARDAGIVSGRIVLVPGSWRGLKVTYPDDLVLAELAAVTEAAP